MTGTDTEPTPGPLPAGEATEEHAHADVTREGFFPGFDGLRAIAALMVLVTHVWLSSRYRGFGSTWLTQLDVGVPVFFVISGFLLYRPFVAARFADRPELSTAAFWKRRALRIFPAYWVCLIVVSIWFYNGPLPIDSVKSAITHGLLLQVYTSDRVIGGPVQQSWTLAVEVAFYAFLPFYAMALRRIRFRRWSPLTVELAGIAVLYLASVVYRLALLSADLTTSEYAHYRIYLPGFLDTLALGMGIAVLSAWLTRDGRRVAAPRWLAPAAWLTALACYAVLAEVLGLGLYPTDTRSGSQFMTEQFFRGVFAVALVLPAVFAARRIGAIHRFLSARVMVALGLVSYGIYLWHEAAIEAYFQWRDMTIFQPTMWKLLVFVLAFSLLVATASYHLVEKPVLRLKQRVLTPGFVRRRIDRWGPFEHRLVLIAFGAFVLRLAYIWFVRRQHFADFGVVGDANFYHRGAQLLAEGKGFINVFWYDLRGIVSQDAGRPPLYMLWLTIPSLLGATGTTAHMLWTLPVGVATVVVAGLAGREMVGPRTGLIAAFLVAVYPNVWSHDGFLISETMAIFTTTLTIWMAYRYWRAPSMRRAVAVGLAVGLAMASRSETLFLVPLMIVPLLLGGRGVSWTDRGKRLVAAGAACVVLVGPWVVYNLTRFEHPVTLSTGYGITASSANCDLTYYGRNIGYWDMKCAIPVEARIQSWKLDQSVAEGKYRKAAFEYIGDHKGRFAVVTLVHWARYTGLWDLTRGFDQVHKDIFPEGRERSVAFLSFWMWLVIAPLAVVGAVVLRRRRIALYIVVAPIVVTIISTTMTFYQNRYRALAETAFCLLAAVAIDAVWRRVERRRAARAPSAS